MCGVCRSREDQEGHKLWSFVLVAIQALGHDGMSDEEEDYTDEEDSSFGTSRRVKIRRILVVPWRHPYFMYLLRLVDHTRFFEEHIFRLSGHPRVRRVMGDRSSDRTIPRGVPRSFFREGFFDGMMEHEVEHLRLAQKDIPLIHFRYAEVDSRSIGANDDDDEDMA